MLEVWFDKSSVAENAAMTRGTGDPPPRIDNLVPVFGIDSYADAKAHYADWLGFQIDWEWREAEGQPVIMALSRDAAAFMLNEYPNAAAPAQVTLKVTNLEGLVAEWNARRPGGAKIVVEPPYEFPSCRIVDSSGNELAFQQPLSAEEQAVRARNRERMQRHVRQRLARGEPFPTPEELRKAIGPDLGTATEVLNEFPGYAAAFKARDQGE